MNSLIYILECIDAMLGDKHVLLIATFASFVLKAIILGFLYFRSDENTAKRAKTFLFIMLCSALFIDFSWMISLTNSLYFPDFDYRIRICIIRFAWAFQALLYTAITLFTDILINKSRNLVWHQKLIMLIYGFFGTSFVAIAVMHFNCSKFTDRSLLELNLVQIFNTVSISMLIGSAFYNLKKIKATNMPSILKHQIKTFIMGIVIPFWLCEVLQFLPFSYVVSNSYNIITNSYAAANISTILTTFAIYFSTRKFIGLRFLNVRSHVERHTRFNFIDGFKDILKQLSYASTLQELHHLTKLSFKEMFNIPTSRVRLYTRSTTQQNSTQEHSETEKIAENFLTLQQNVINECIRTNHGLIYDEIAFSNFYAQEENLEPVLGFLHELNADIFLPVHTQERIIGYIVVERFARPHQFYSNVEHDEMAVFANYLANIIDLFQRRNIDFLIKSEKELQEELYNKHQEINRYKESIRSFLRNNRQCDTGIIFYKNRRFTYGNQIAKELININLNQQQGHPLTQKLKAIVQKVQDYKTPQRCFAEDKQGNKLVLSAVPHLDQNNVIIVVYYPEVSDIIRKQIDSLKDPSKWDYLLYLETTESGKLINQLIPGTGEQMLNFKISLLEASLSRKAILLEMPEEDLLPTVQLLHHISLREVLHIIKLHRSQHVLEVATKLFGINPIFGQQQEPPILERLDKVGTVFIQHIHLLDMEAQEYLAEYLTYGTFRTFKSDQKTSSNVRIICSTGKNLNLMVQEGTFSAQLFNQLKNYTLSMPSLHAVTDEEIHELASGFSDQAIKADDFKNLLELTDKEKSKISTARPVSLQELKTKVQTVLQKKSKKSIVQQETAFDEAYEITDPELMQAARLGKQALRNEKIMALLWSKFQSQSKIASFLGVNRSSVNRRCKKFEL
jgi:transcriptional regulator with GAF, ATPase, and Fis domain